MIATQPRFARGRGIVTLTLGLTAALLLLGLGSRTAGAANPTLTTSQNPVVIPYGANTKAITINWNLNGLAQATLLISELGGPGGGFTQISAQTGSTPLTVTFGKSYTALLLDLSTASAVAVLEITTKRPAANPTISASENPVVIAYGANTKAITLGWTLDGIPAANLVLTENGGPTILSTQVHAQAGSTPATVTYGKSYQAALKDPASNATLASIAITTKRPPLQNPGGGLLDCLVELCITDVDFAPHGTYAELTAKTSKPAKFQIAVGLSAPSANGDLANPVSGMFNLQYVTLWDSNVWGLNPNTTYHYVLRAEAQNGETEIKTGTFKTLKRKVEVTFTDITVHDDSDDLSACDCDFWFTAGTSAQGHWPGGFASIPSGTTVHPNLKLTVVNAGDTLLVRVLGRDDDRSGFFLEDCDPAPGWDDGSGANNCWDWSQAQKNLPVGDSGLGEEFEDSFSFYAGGGPLKFTVHGTFKVTFVP